MPGGIISAVNKGPIPCLKKRKLTEIIKPTPETARQSNGTAAFNSGMEAVLC